MLSTNAAAATSEQMDFCLEFHNESELKLAVAQMDQITGLAVTQLSPMRVGLVASFDLLLETCEEKAWKRRLKQSDEWIEFTWETRQEFANAYDPLQFFTSAERVYLISVVIAPIKAKRAIALNNLEQHQTLYRAWIQSSLFAPQPLDLICNYYGEEIALYFAFLGHYTAWLLPLAVLGVVTFAHQFYFGLYSWPSLMFAVSAMVWDTLFFESWKRKEKLLAFEWNGISTQARIHEIQRKLHYKRKIPWIIGYFLSFTLLIVSFVGKAWIVRQILWLEEKDLAFLHHLPLASKAPSVLLALAIMSTSQFNRALAVFCTQTLEQRSTVEEAKGAIVLKLVLQHFVNSHAVLLYIAFVERDLDRLKSTLMSLVVLNQMYGQVLEVGIPLIQSGLLSKLVMAGRKSLPPKSALEAELDLVAYSGVFSDYLELWVQMGQIGLYSSVFPLSALASLVNNVMEIKTDAFRLMCTSTRPVPFSKPNGIGNWLIVFETLGFVSLATNAGLAFVLVQHQYESCLVGCWSDFSLLLVLVAVEHVAVVAKVSLKFFIPDMPKEIQNKVAQNLHRESIVQRQRLEHRIKIQRLVASKQAAHELAGGGNAALEQEALVEYAAQQTKARVQAEEAMKKAELELHKTRQSQGAMHTLGVTVVWLNLAVAALAAGLLFSGM